MGISSGLNTSNGKPSLAKNIRTYLLGLFAAIFGVMSLWGKTH